MVGRHPGQGLGAALPTSHFASGLFSRAPGEPRWHRPPDALLRRAGAIWRDLWPLIRQSLWCGESVLLHCISGRHRAAGGGTLCRAVMLSETWEESARWLKTQRDTDLPGLMRDQKVARFLREASTSTALGTPWPRPPTWRPSGVPCTCSLQGFTNVPLCFHEAAH